MRMKKFFLSFFVFAASAGYVLYQYLGGTPVNAAITPAQPQTSEVATTIDSNAAPPSPPSSAPQTQTQPKPTLPVTPTPAPTPAPAAKPKGQYADGTYTGNSADAYYGFVQVQAVIQGGKLVTVNFLQYPSDRRTSQYINSQAMPLLKSEAIQAQSANVSGVSGASDTSMAFRESLGNALAQAKN